MSKKTKELVLATSDGLQLKSLTVEESKEKIITVLDYVAKDLGLTEKNKLGEYDYARFAQLIGRHYSWLTLSDIKMAFELYLLKEIHVEFYGIFSAAFYTELMRKYITYKSKINLEDRLALPVAKVTDEQKAEIRTEFEAMLVKSYYKFKETGKISHSSCAMYVYQYWSKYNWLVEEPNVNDRDIVIALRELTEEMAGRNFKLDISDEQKEIRAKSLAHYRSVRDLYALWIEEDVKIENQIKKNYE